MLSVQRTFWIIRIEELSLFFGFGLVITIPILSTARSTQHVTFSNLDALQLQYI